ncbi:MAG: ribonuclease D [Rhodospirillales bacterium]|nr:ribonuclease D [Rhodospirillales bacterium]
MNRHPSRPGEPRPAGPQPGGAELVAESGALADFCRRIERAPFVTVDTEFMRERTYGPILCVVQVAGGGMDDDPDSAAAIDALAPGLDLAPLFEILGDPGVLKVFHAARQDMEIFYYLMKKLPAPVFDTQVAAMVCGFGDSASYETLVGTLTRARIDKSSRFTDWSVRPLSERQITYALADVIHLRRVYEELSRRLAANGRETWLQEDMATLTAETTYDVDPSRAWLRLKARGGGRFLAVLREVAAWREREAQRRDLPRGRIVRDEALIEIAHHRPTTADALARTRGLGARLAEGPMGADLLRAIAAGLAVQDKDCPRLEEKSELPNGLGPVTDLLKVLLKLKSENSGVAQKLLASVADLERIAAFGENASVAALSGWRRDVFGADALRLIQGEIALSAQGRRIKLSAAKSES